MDRLAVVGTIALFLISAGFLSFFVFFVDPRYLSFSGFIVFYLTLFVLLWSAEYATMRFITRKRRGRVAGLSRKCALIAFCITGGALLSHVRWLSVYTILMLIVLAGGIEYYSKKR